MAEVKKATKTAKAKAPAGPKFSQRFAREDGAVVRVSATKRRNGYVAVCYKFPEGDGAERDENGKLHRRPAELIKESGTFPDFTSAENVAKEYVIEVEKASYGAQAKRGGRVAAGFEAL